MKSKEMQEANDPMIQLFRTVEEALGIVGEKAVKELNLALDSAELETSLVVTKVATGGFKIDAVGFDASGKATSESTHLYRLKLKRQPRKKAELGMDAVEVAASIFAILEATNQIKLRTTQFRIDEATVIVDLTRSKEGGLKVFGGGEGKSGNTCRVTLKFILLEV
jgi:hypothetical protein